MSTRGHHGLLLGGGGASNPYLDGLSPSPRSVLSLRKMISTATQAIRVRRSSDSAQQDIGFTGDALDTASLATFIGSDSAYVVTMYDQTGNGYNASQATAANQPRIANAGVYDGKLVFNGTSHWMRVTSLLQGTPYVGLYGKLRMANANATKIIVESGTNYNTTAGSLIFHTQATNIYPMGSSMGTGGGGIRSRLWSVTAASMRQFSCLYDRSVAGSGELRMWVDGSVPSESGGATNDQTGNFATLDHYIGARAGSSLFADLELETLVFYNADTDAIRTQIQTVIA